MKKTYLYTLVLLAFISLFSSCKKEDDDNDDNNNNDDPIEYNDLSLHFMNKWDGEAFEYDTEYTLNGITVKFQDIRFYLSNFMVSDGAGNTATLPTVALIDAGSTGHVDLGQVDEDFLFVDEIDFLLGLDEVTNHQDPTLAEAPLNDGTMHWGWAPEEGYKFIKIEGERDLIGDGTFVPFAIHAATDSLKRSITKVVEQDVENDALMIMTMVDYKMFFDGLDLSADPLGGTHGDTPLTNGVADNVEDAITMP